MVFLREQEISISNLKMEFNFFRFIDTHEYQHVEIFMSRRASSLLSMFK